MNRFIKALFFSLITLHSVGVYAEVCNAQNRWWPYCNDPATGPDVGTAEWIYCQAHGGCDYS